MFQLDWAKNGVWANETQPLPPQNSQLKRETVRRTSLLHWEEHCQECAIPICFTSCPLYVPRADKGCSRFVYGIYPNPNFQGLFDFGADIRFRRWGKLETILYGKSVNVRVHRSLDWMNRFVTHRLRGASESNQPASFAREMKGNLAVFGKTNLAKVRNKLFGWTALAGANVAYDEFVLECFSPDRGTFRLMLDYFAGKLTPDHTFVGEMKLRHSFNILPGWNFYALPARAFGFDEIPSTGKMTIYPENNAERRLILTWLDLVQYREAREPKINDSHARPLPAEKVKCVAWDLDDTLWEGILTEDSETNLLPRSEALQLIKKLDERGIIQTVVSKNNFADAWPIIGRLGLQDYFLYPAINWQPKSSNLNAVAAKLNLNPDAFALIDDSPFERAEVQSSLPQVRVYSEDEIGTLLTYSEFDVPVSESSRKRRVSYLTEITREKERAAYRSDYESFLRNCKMKLRLFTLRDERHIVRCLELIQRSNQLNLSNTRYTAEEFRQLLSNPGLLCVALDCTDRFGAYGIVGFASVDERQEKPVLKDLVLSCRVAQKRVEHTFLEWLAGREASRGLKVLLAELVKTDRNKPIRQVFDDLRFRELKEENGRSLMEWTLDPNFTVGKIIEVEAEADLQAEKMTSKQDG